MSDPASAFEVYDRPDIRPTDGPDTSWTEQFSANASLMIDDIPVLQDWRDNYQKTLLVRRVAEATGKSVGSYDNSSFGNMSSSIEYNMADVWSDIQGIRNKNPDAFSDLPKTLDEYLGNDKAANLSRRHADQSVESRGTSLSASLLGSMAGSMADPLNLMTLPIGGGAKSLIGVFGREALINGAVETLQQPIVAGQREKYGEELSFAEGAANVSTAALAGGVLSVMFVGAGRGGKSAYDKLSPKLVPLEKRLAKALAKAEVDDIAFLDRKIVEGIFSDLDDDTLSELVTAVRGDQGLSGAEQAATSIVSRQNEIDLTNPYEGSLSSADNHADKLSDALERTLRDLPPANYDAAARAGLPDDPVVRSSSPVDGQPSPAPARAADTGDFDMTGYLQRNRTAESGGNDRAAAQTSSAYGRYQFLKSTWLDYYKKTFGSTGESRSAILAKRADGSVQDKVMQRFTADNVRYLARIGARATKGNTYLTHFLGRGDAGKVLQAAPDTPVSALVSSASIAANKSVLAGKSASEVIAWAHRKMGGKAASVPAGGGRVSVDEGADAAEILRSEALELKQQAYELQGIGRMESESFDPKDIGVDAKLMQFKDGGDEFGVTDRLQGVDVWNPVLAGRAIVWEGNDGRRLIADGHQRLGLAKRIASADPSQNVRLDALVMRESDGWDAESARVWAALKNVAEGSGSPVDAAKIMRGMGVDEATSYLPPRSALVRDGQGLARLGDDAFGAVVNELVDPSHAAIVGRMASDPGEQKALVDLLIKFDPQTLSQANSVIAQGRAAGFVKETQDDMFGSLDSTASLFIERAKILERGLSELKKLKQVFGTAARNAETLEGAGNKIAKGASEKEALDNGQAIEIVERLAWRAGPIKDAIDRAAEQLASGGQLRKLTAEFVNAIRDLDIEKLARSGDNTANGVLPDGSGRIGDVAEAGSSAPPERGYSDEPDQLDGAWPSRDEIEQAGQSGFDIFDEAATRGFDDPGGDGARIQTESLEHDARLIADDANPDINPDAAALQRQQLQLKADSPLRSIEEPEGTIGAELFDAANQDGLDLRAVADELSDELGYPAFNVDGEERTLSGLLDEFDEDAVMIEKAKQCL